MEETEGPRLDRKRHSDPVAALESIVLHFLGVPPAPEPACNDDPAAEARVNGAAPVPTIRNVAYCALYFRVLAQLHHNLVTGTTCTQRDLYYAVVQHAANQIEVNRILLRIAASTGLSRASLAVSAGTRGALAGCVRVGDVDGTTAPPCGIFIPGSFAGDVGEPERELPIECWASCILVVEKDAVFQRLVAERLFVSLPCVIITGRGFPDLATRAMVHRLAALRPDCPVLGLADFNPSGVHVLLQYRRGNARVPESLPFAVPRLCWLGVHADDVPLGSSARNNPLSARDRQQLEKLLVQLGADDRPRSHAAGRQQMSRLPDQEQRNSSSVSVPFGNSPFRGWLRELHVMDRCGFKADIEAVTAETSDPGTGNAALLSAFVRSKVLQQRFV